MTPCTMSLSALQRPKLSSERNLLAGLSFHLRDGTEPRNAPSCFVQRRRNYSDIGYPNRNNPGDLCSERSRRSNTWNVFEFEVVINNTTGCSAVRKNGNSSNDFDSGAALNTRGGTDEQLCQSASGIGLTSGGVICSQIDDFFWRSDASSVAWLGDIKCVARMPASDAGAVLARAGDWIADDCHGEHDQFDHGRARLLYAVRRCV